MVFLLVPQDLALPWLSCAGANSWVSFSILLVTTWMGPCSRMGPFCSAWSWVSQNNICLSVPCGDVIYDQPSPKSGLVNHEKTPGHSHPWPPYDEALQAHFPQGSSNSTCHRGHMPTGTQGHEQADWELLSFLQALTPHGSRFAPHYTLPKAARV